MKETDWFKNLQALLKRLSMDPEVESFRVVKWRCEIVRVDCLRRMSDGSLQHFEWNAYARGVWYEC